MTSRRAAVQALAGIGTLAGVGALARFAVLAPPASASQNDVNGLAASLFDAVPEAARAATCLPFDHPLRQYYNRGLPLGGLTVNAASLDWASRRCLAALVAATLSAAGRARVPDQDATRLTGVNFKQLLFFGDPRSGPYQALLSGVHLNLRLGGSVPQGVAFGGPQVYGDQRGNGESGLPGNTYRYQLASAQRLWSALTPAERAAARQDRAPAQTNIGLQGKAGRFDGVAIGNLALPTRRLAREVVASILDTYADSGQAWDCLERNGGIEALHFADYDIDFEGGRRAGDAPSQIFRLEGPATVLHFRGEPHVHAFIHVAQSAGQQVSLGEVLGENRAVLEAESLRTLFEAAMRERAHADAAYYPKSSIAGRLRAGMIRTGDVWVAESWVDELIVAELRGADLGPAGVAALRARGVAPQRDRHYRIATTGFVAQDSTMRGLGDAYSRRSLGLVRDALAAHVRTQGFGLRG